MSRFLEWASVVGRIDHEQLLSVLDTMLRVLLKMQPVNHLRVPNIHKISSFEKPYLVTSTQNVKLILTSIILPTHCSCSTKGSWVTNMIKMWSPKITLLMSVAEPLPYHPALPSTPFPTTLSTLLPLTVSLHQPITPSPGPIPGPHKTLALPLPNRSYHNMILIRMEMVTGRMGKEHYY